MQRLNKIADHIGRKRGIRFSTHGIDATATPADRAYTGLHHFDEVLVAPKRNCPEARGRFAFWIEILIAAAGGTHAGIGIIRPKIAERLRMIDRCSVGKDQHLSPGYLYAFVLGIRLSLVPRNSEQANP